MNAKVVIEKYPTSFFVVDPPPRVIAILDTMDEALSKKDVVTEIKKNPFSGKNFRVKVPVVLARYSTKTSTRRRRGYLNSELQGLMVELKRAGFNDSTIEIVKPKPYEVAKCDFGMEDFQLRKHQVPAAEHIKKDDNQSFCTLEARTGWGKTAMGIYEMARRGKRTLFSMTPGHLKTWRKSLQGFTNVADDEVYLIAGGESITKAIELSREGKFDYKVVLCSTPTLREYIKLYEANPDDFAEDETPFRLWATLGIGFVVRDEVHEHLHALTLQVIYNCVEEQLLLTATIVTDDNFIKLIHAKIFPLLKRWKSDTNKHITMHPLFYSSNRPIPSSSPFGYSHLKYEKNILRSKKLTANYMKLIHMAAVLWKREYKEGKNMMVIASTKLMCKQIVDFLSGIYPDLCIKTFIHKDKEENLYESDIVVGTPKSIGTGIDKKNLSLILLTTALGSTGLSLQIAGRPRPQERYPDDDPRFIYLVNRSIQPHVSYHNKRKIYMANNIKSQSPIESNFSIN